MVGVEYGNSKVEVTYSQSRNRSSSSCGSSLVVVVILLPNFIQLQTTSNGNKTANIYVKNCSVYIGYRLMVTS